MTLKKIEMAWIVVADLKKSLEYYTSVLGMTLLEHNEQYGWAELSCDDGSGPRLGIAQATDLEPDQKPGQNAVVTFTVDDLEKAKAQFASKGAQFRGEVLVIPGMVKMQTFVDLDGNNFQLVEVLGS